MSQKHRAKDRAWPRIPGMSLVAECWVHHSGITRYSGTFRVQTSNSSCSHHLEAEHVLYCNWRLQQPQYILWIHLNWQRWRSSKSIGWIKQHITHTQCDAAEIWWLNEFLSNLDPSCSKKQLVINYYVFELEVLIGDHNNQHTAKNIPSWIRT